MASRNIHLVTLRRYAFYLILLALTIATVLLALYTLRHEKPVPAALDLAASTAAPADPVGVAPTRAPIALGASLHLSAAPPAVLARGWGAGGCTVAPFLDLSADGGAHWAALPQPARDISALAFISGEVGVVAGYDERCTPALWRTSTGGSSWLPVPGVTGAVSAVEPTRDGALWLIHGGRVARAGPGSPLVPVAADPCARGSVGPARLLSAVSVSRAWVVCAVGAGAGGQRRLLYGTSDAGARWTELAGARTVPSTGRVDGLDGDGSVAALQFVDAATGTALVVTASCPSGALRRSADGGRTWRAVACLPAEALTSRARPRFLDAQVGYLALPGAGTGRTLRTRDGGRTWAATG